MAGAVGLVGAAVVGGPVPPAVTSVVVAVVGSLVAAAFFTGPALHGAPRRPWQCFGLSFVLSVLSVPVYAWARDRTGLAASAQNAVDAVAFAVSPATVRTRLADEITAAPPSTG